MYIQLLENIGTATPTTKRYFFLSVYSNTYPLSNSFQIVTAINPRFKTIADGYTAQFLKVSTSVRPPFCKIHPFVYSNTYPLSNKLQYK